MYINNTDDMCTGIDDSYMYIVYIPDIDDVSACQQSRAVILIMSPTLILFVRAQQSSAVNLCYQLY